MATRQRFAFRRSFFSPSLLAVAASRSFLDGTDEERRRLLADNDHAGHRVTKSLVEHATRYRASLLENVRLGLPTPPTWRKLEGL